MKIKPINIQARFIGEDSLGYEHGKVYKIKVVHIIRTTIKKLDETGLCQYDSTNTFLNNWNEIKHL